MNNMPKQIYIAFIGISEIGKTTVMSELFSYLSGETSFPSTIDNELRYFHNENELILTDCLNNIKNNQRSIIVCLIDYNKQEESRIFCRDIIEKEELSDKHLISFYINAPYNYEDYFQSNLLGKELSLDYLLNRIEDLL